MIGKRIALILLLMASNAAYSQEDIKILCFELAPYCYIENDELKGLSIDLFKAMRKNMDSEFPDVKLLSLSRSIKKMDHENIVMLFLARTKSREEKYQWISLIYKDSLVFVTPIENEPIDSFEQARHAGNILTREKAATDETLLANGVSNIDASTMDENGQFLKLLRGRAKIWFSPKCVAQAVLKKHHAEAKFHIGKPVADMNLYMAGSKKTPQHIIDKLRVSFSKIDKQKIYETYDLE